MDTLVSSEFLARLRAFIRRRVGSDADADDLVQDVLARLVERRDEVREEGMAAWLFTVARRAIIDRYRSRSAAARREKDLPAGESGDADASVELARCLEPMLAQLDAEDQDLLRRIDMSGQNQAEIARELGVAVSTIKSKTQRARARLHSVLTDCCRVATDSRGKPYDFELRKGKSCSHCKPDEGGCA